MISDQLLEILRRPEFWPGWYQLHDEVELGTDKTIEVTAGDQHLLLELDASDLGIEKDGEWFRVGWDLGQDRGDPHALRWEEVDLIGRAIALRGGPPHPGSMLALFGRFAPLCPGEDDRAATLTAALVRANAPTHLIAPIVSTVDWRDSDFRWRRDEHAWLLEGKFIYTVRKSSAQYDEPDEISLLRDGIGSGWIERPALRAEIDRFFTRLEGEVAAMIDPRWRTPNVLALATAAATDPGAATVLVDALQEAGCAHRAILAILAGAPEQRAWLIDMIAGAPR